MTDHNKKKLRHIIDDEPALQRLVQLPQTVLASLDLARPTLTDALALQSCLAIQIELHAPMRAKNLAALDFAQHFDVVSPNACHIDIKPLEVKNDQSLHYVLGPSFIRLLTVYRDVYWPLLAGKSKTTAVFISRAGRQKPPDALGAQVAKFLKARAGIAMNIHLFRHLAGYLFLKEHPGEYEPVRQVLGHKSIRTTVGFYLGLEQEHSFKRYDQIIQAFGKKEPEDVDA
jgi:integrase